MTPKLRKVIRLDSLPFGQTMFTEEGYLMDRPILTSTGIFEYRNPDGTTRRELRLPEEVFSEKSLQSYKGKPIIITHQAGLITKNNVGEEQIGTILSEGYKSGEDVRAEIVIHDTNEMRNCGLKELSLGYNLDLEETPGVWQGERYDAIQRNISINHLALVREARAGEQARLNIDSRDDKILKGEKVMSKKKRMKKTTHKDGVLTPEELEKAIEEYKAKRDAQAAPEKEEAKEEPAPAPVPAPVPVAPAKDADDTEALAEANMDIAKLIDIIDTLLAEKEFDAADEEKPEDDWDDFSTDGDDGDDEDGEFVDVEVEENEDEDDEDFEEDEDDTDDEDLELDEDDDEDDGDVEFYEDEDDDLPDEDEDFEEDEDDIPEDEDEDFEEDEDDEIPDDEDEDFEEDEDDLPDDDEDLEEDEDDMPDDDDEDFDEDEDDIPDDDEDEDMNTDACKKDCGSNYRFNGDEVDKIVRTRIQLGMLGRQLNLDGLENKSIKSAKKAIIHKMRPKMNLDGKSDSYINAAYDMAVAEAKKKLAKGTKYQQKQMFNNKPSRQDSKDNLGARAARDRMIKKMKEK